MLMHDANGFHITPAMARQMMAKIALKFGDVDGLDFWAEMHPAQAAEWDQCAIPVQYINARNIDETELPKRTFMGFPLEVNVHLPTSLVLIRKNREVVAEIGNIGLTNWDVEAANRN